jgi:hypothetical protein
MLVIEISHPLSHRLFAGLMQEYRSVVGSILHILAAQIVLSSGSPLGNQ